MKANESKPAPRTKGDFEYGTIRGRPRRVVRGILLLLLRITIKLRIEHIERAPKGAAIVVSNHLHNADPILTTAAYPEPIHYMAKKEVFKIPILRPILRWCGVFPVDRGKSDRNAIRRAEAALQRGIAIGMYPEGTRSVTRALAKAHAGVGLIALRSEAPILPVVVTGTERLPFNGARGRAQASAGSPMPDPGHRGVRILFGEPFFVPREIDGKRVTPEMATELIMIEIARLLPPDYRGIYADKVQPI